LTIANYDVIYAAQNGSGLQIVFGFVSLLGGERNIFAMKPMEIFPFETK
jgi:uncharacterized PurR-regulated membrane protein YhhQ (DUF165 family)